MPRFDPRVRLLGRVDGALEVWRVDGAAIRERLDVDFTNGHHHLSRPYVPEHEIWLDREARGAGEWPIWALRQRVERERMAAGATYFQAVDAARHVERAARRAAGRSKAIARRQHLGKAGHRDIWIVDGRAVRDLAFIDFTLGGHGYRYRFIPKGEIWIDDAVAPAERGAVICHEAVEVGLMAKGMGYAEAHSHASAAEAASAAAPGARSAS